jgi:maleylacetate reductase
MSARRWSLDAHGTVFDGSGSRQAITRLLDRSSARRTMLVSNRSLRGTIVFDDIAARIQGGPVAMFAAIGANAPAADVEAATTLGRDAGVDSIVAVGGSSVTDAAKIVRLRLLGDEVERERIPLLLVPTTLSSGELTAAAGMTGEVPGEKTYVIDTRMAPTAVILDPEVTVGTPRELWLSTGVKAIDHAAEALWTERPHPYSDALAADALRRLLRALPACAADPADLDARLDAQLGGWFSMAGMTRHGPGPSHLLGHQLAARWRIAHGVTSCITLAPVLRWAANRGRPGAHRVAELLSADSIDAADAALTTFIVDLGLPTRLRDVGADRSEIGAIAAAAARHGRTVGFEFEGGEEPEADVEMFRRLLESCW